jgi:hypothetical protein
MSTPCGNSIDCFQREGLAGRPTCYKPSSFPYLIWEVLVRHDRDLRSLDQLMLFHPLPKTPQWMSLPAEVREQTLKLLARLLRQHRRARLARRHLAGEVCDE